MRDQVHGRRIYEILFQVRLVFITIACSGFSVALSILVLPSVIVLYTVYMCTYLYLKIKYGNTIARANGLDIMYVVDYPGSTSYVNTISAFNGSLSWQELLKKLECFISLNPDNADVCRRTQQRFENHFGYTFFRDDPDFSLDNHISVVTKEDLFGKDGFDEYYKRIMARDDEESYGEFIETEEQLVAQRMLELYGNRKVSADRPQWECIYYQDHVKKRGTLMFHAHHGISDGINFLRYFFEHFGDKKVEYTLPYTFHNNSWIKRWGINLFSFFMMPFGIWRLTYQRGLNPLHGQTLSGEKIYVKSRPYPLAKMKEIKNKYGCTMITLLFNSLAYALRCNFTRKGEKIRKTLGIVPVPQQDFSKPPVFRNDHGLQGILLRTTALDPEKDSALNRLDETMKLLYISVRDPSFLPIQWIIMHIGPLLPQSVLKAVFKLEGFTTSLSNLSGPQEEPFTISDGRGVVTDSQFWLPDRAPMGMGFSSSGYMGNVSFALIVDKALMKNYREAYMFLEDFISELENLRTELSLNSYTDY